VGPGRWELLRALGMAAADPAAMGELGLEPVGATGHDEVFAVNCPPFASLYLGEGHLGLDGPSESDHLAGLLDRYAALGEAGEDGARRVMFGEFLWPWLPAYLGAVRDLPSGPLTRWAELAAEPERAARWLAGEADHWARWHSAGQHGATGPDLVQLWWAERAAGTARLLRGPGPQVPGDGRETECVSAAD
jgi:hypothetical protein